MAWSCQDHDEFDPLLLKACQTAKPRTLDAEEGSGSIELDGANYIEAPRIPVEGPGAALAGWAKLTESDDAGSELVSLGDAFSLLLDSPDYSGTVARGYNGSGWEAAPATRGLEGAGWHHLAASYREDLLELSFYLDGSLVGTKLFSQDLAPKSLGSTIRIGEHSNGSSDRSFTGLIDDIRVYNRPISEAEIRAAAGTSTSAGLRIVRWAEIANP